MLRKGLLIWVWALVLLLLPGWEGRAEPARYRVTANYVNIREGPGKNYRVLSQRFKGDIVTVIEMHNAKWARIRFGNSGTAYIYREYIEYEGPSIVERPQVQKQTPAPRKGPSLDVVFQVVKLIAILLFVLGLLLTLMGAEIGAYLSVPFMFFIPGYVLGWLLGNAHLWALIGVGLAVVFVLFGIITDRLDSGGPLIFNTLDMEEVGFGLWKIMSWPFFALNWFQLFLSKPWRIAMKENWAIDSDKEFYRKLFRGFQVPLYFVAAPVRLINAVYYNLVIHLLYELTNYILEVFAPTDVEMGRGDPWKWIVWFPVRVLFFLGYHFTLTVIESIIWTVIDVFVPAVTLFHGTEDTYASEIVCEPFRTRGSRRSKAWKTGTWAVGIGNFAGDGIYFGISRKTLKNYQRGCCIVARVSMGKTIDTTLMPDVVYKAAGSRDAHEVSKWGLTHGYTTGEWWRTYPGWWEFCLFDRQNRYNDSWRIRPVYVLNYENGVMQRIRRGTAHWLFRKMVLHDIAVSLRLIKD